MFKGIYNVYFAGLQYYAAMIISRVSKKNEHSNLISS